MIYCIIITKCIFLCRQWLRSGDIFGGANYFSSFCDRAYIFGMEWELYCVAYNIWMIF